VLFVFGTIQIVTANVIEPAIMGARSISRAGGDRR
jgi:predicted PurR-regulated permease PerM